MSGSLTFAVSFRLFHPKARADEMASAIGLKANVLRSFGDERKTPSGTRLSGIYDRSAVVFSLEEIGATTLEEKIGGTLRGFLLAKADYISKLLATGGRAEFFIGVFAKGNVGITLDGGLIQELASVGISLSFDVYGGD